MKIEKYLNASPLFALHWGSETIFKDLNRLLHKEDVNFLQALLLLTLFFEQGPVQPSTMATLLKTTRGNVSHMVSSLEKHHWLQRKTNPKDARQYLLILTSAGNKKALQLIRLFDGLQGHFEKHLSEQRVARLAKNIEGLVSLYRSF